MQDMKYVTEQGDPEDTSFGGVSLQWRFQIWKGRVKLIKKYTDMC